jgi:hypothetical protein
MEVVVSVPRDETHREVLNCSGRAKTTTPKLKRSEESKRRSAPPNLRIAHLRIRREEKGSPSSSSSFVFVTAHKSAAEKSAVKGNAIVTTIVKTMIAEVEGKREIANDRLIGVERLASRDVSLSGVRRMLEGN